MRADAVLGLRDGTGEERGNCTEHDCGSTSHVSIYVTNASRMELRYEHFFSFAEFLGRKLGAV